MATGDRAFSLFAHVRIFSGQSHPDRAREVCARLGVPLSPSQPRRFRNDNFLAQLLASVPLYLWFKKVSELFPRLTPKGAWRPLVVGLLALQTAACKPTFGSEVQTPSPPIVEPYTPRPTLTVTPTSTPTETPTPQPTLTPTPPPTETPTPEVSSFVLSPTTLTKEKAEGFIFEAKQWSEEKLQKRLQGRVFVDEKTGAIFVLSPDVYNSLLSQISFENPLSMSGNKTTQEIIYRLENSWWLKRLADYGDYQQLKKEGKINNYIKLYPRDVVLIDTNYLAIFRNKEFVLISFPTIVTEKEVLREGGEGWKEIGKKSPYRIRDVWWSDEKGKLFSYDDYQMSAVFEINEKGEGNWRLVLPHERRSGQYEILTPSQRMIKAMNDLKKFTGYDAGDWQGKDEDFSPYTFTYGGKKYTIDVSPVKNDEGEIVYEVVRDPKTKEMMLTVIKSTDTQITSGQEITSIPQDDIEALRQTWALLLAADPEIMEKFWRVNKVVALAANSKMKDEWGLASTGTGIGNGNAFVNIYNATRSSEGSLESKLPSFTFFIVVESYERYAGDQFPTTFDNWQYPPGSVADGIQAPADCLDNNSVRSAAEMAFEWYKVYGKNLPQDIAKVFESIIKWWIGELKSFPCQPQIPFVP